MPLNDAYTELKGKAAEGRVRTGGTDRKERRTLKLASCPCAAIFVHVSAKDRQKGFEFLTCGRGCPVTRQVSSRVSPSLMV